MDPNEIFRRSMATFFFFLFVFCVIGGLVTKDRTYILGLVIFGLIWWWLRKTKV